MFSLDLWHLNFDSQEFGGRAEFLANFVGGEDSDIYGHGTLVAGISKFAKPRNAPFSA